MSSRSKGQESRRTARARPYARRPWTKSILILAKREKVVIPNLITSVGLLLGCYAVVLSVNENFYRAAFMIEFAALCDGLDGLVARASRTGTRFGIEYDSLSDVIAFGIAPASLAYMWALRPLLGIGLIEAGLFVLSGALRLARFNVESAVKSRHFTGLPIPGAAVCLAGLFFICNRLGISSPRTLYMLAGPIVPLLALLMVSRVPYPNLKGIRLKVWIREILAVLMVLAVLLLVIPEITLFVAALAYLLSGPLWMLLGGRGWVRRLAIQRHA